jgi:hydroxymethylpyrimidine pyrophosphatase-like HAD family hydrolase
VKIIVCDLDGTLFLDKKIYHFLLKVLIRFSWFRKLYLNIKERNGKRVKFLAKLFIFLSDQLDEIYTDKPILNRGARKFFKKARDKGIKVFISSSSKSQRIKKLLKKSHINNLFDDIFGREIAKKYHIKEIFLKQSLVDKDRKKILVIANEPADLLFSKKEGINHVIMISNPFSKEELMDWGVPEENIFRNFDEINKKIFCQ